MSIFKDYVRFHNDAQSEYGVNSIVLMEVGSFYEVYAVQTDSVQIGPPIYELGDLLNIQVTKKNKTIEKVCESNHLMAGFPKYCVNKYVDLLLSNNYTIVLVEQVTAPPNSKREVTKIFSPSMVINEMRSYESNLMMVIYFERITHLKSNHSHMNIGWSTFDASTGKSECNEIANQLDDKVLLDEVYRLILRHNPRELVLLSKNDDIDSDYLIKYLDLQSICIHNKCNSMNPMFEKIKFQKGILSKVFHETGMLSVIEYINLEFKQLGIISFTYMVQFIYEHNELLLHKLRKPIVEDIDDSQLVMAYNSIQQLNIVGGEMSVLSMLNTCQTAVGKRFFKKCLLHPVTTVPQLQDSYARTEFAIANDLNLVCKDLTKVVDIERYCRKIHVDKLNPCEFHALYTSLCTLRHILTDVHAIEGAPERFVKLAKYVTTDQFSTWRNLCEDTFVMRDLSKYNLDSITGNIFKEGLYVELDAMFEEKKAIRESFQAIARSVSDNWLKEECNDREGYHFSMTSKRWDGLKAKSHPITTKLSKLSSTGTMIRLTSPDVKSENKRLQEIEKEFQAMSVSHFTAFLKTMMDTFANMFEDAVSLLEVLDFHVACARNATRFGFTQPELVDASDSFLQLEDVRHPIIEHLQKNVDYTPNSVTIGGSDDTRNGIILYGVNSSGKSSLMKSIGIAVILAQAGMYVPCAKMTFSPYKELFTRIQNTDNIFKGLSTFANEISELRNIFKRAGRHSLIIGDELCSGTESVSAISIVTAGIETLVKLNATFLFATHLHELNNLERIKTLVANSKIAVQHLSVYYDETLKALVYDRKLKDGPGNALYGLEVCKAMDMEHDFIHLASMIRHELMDKTSDIIPQKVSRYNTKVIVDQCKICDSKNDIEVHHIRFQRAANENGLIDNRFHKNAQFNLVPLCEQCHDDVHNDKVSITGWVQTSVGVRLQYTTRA